MIGRIVRLAGFALAFIVCVGLSNIIVESTSYQWGLYQDRQAGLERDRALSIHWLPGVYDAAQADNLTGNGSYFQADGVFVCLNAGQFTFCNPITGTITSSALSALTLNADASAGTTGILFTQAATGTQSTTVPELNLSYSSTAGTNGCPDTSTGNVNLLLQITGASTAHAFVVKCDGDVVVKSVNATAAFTVNGGTILGANAAAAPALALNANAAAPQITCANITACEEDYSSVMTFKNNGGISGAGVNFKYFTGTAPTDTIDFLGNGGINENTGDFVNTAGSVVANATTNANGQVRSGGCANVTGAKGIGVICANGMYYAGTACSLANGTTTNASPSLLTTLTTGQTKCKITSGSATATIFNISMPGAVTLSNAVGADCQFTTSIANIMPAVTSSSTLCILTYTVAPGAVLLGQLDINGNGP